MLSVRESRRWRTARFAAGLRARHARLGALALAWAIAALARRRSRRGSSTRPTPPRCPGLAGGRHRGRPRAARGRRARLSQPRTRRLGVLAMLAGVAWFGAGLGGRGAAVGAPAQPRRPDRTVRARARPPPCARAPGGRLRSPAAPCGARGGIRDSRGGEHGRAPSSATRCSTCTAGATAATTRFWSMRNPGSPARSATSGCGARSRSRVGLVAFALHRLRAGSAPARRAAAAAARTGRCWSARRRLRTRSRFCALRWRIRTRTGFAAIFLARSLSYTLLALGLAWTVPASPAHARARWRDSPSDLGEAPPPGTLRDTLAAALGDPGIEVAVSARRIPISSSTRTDIPPSCRPPAAGSPGSRAAGGRSLWCCTTRALVDEPELARALGSAAKLAVENEALRAEALAQLHELQASRTRIVETGDAARRRLERNLHDGAQQRLLALSYDLRVARAGARDTGTKSSSHCWTQPRRNRRRARGAARTRTRHLPGDPHRGRPRRRRSRRSPTRRRCPWSSGERAAGASAAERRRQRPTRSWPRRSRTRRRRGATAVTVERAPRGQACSSSPSRTTERRAARRSFTSPIGSARSPARSMSARQPCERRSHASSGGR